MNIRHNLIAFFFLLAASAALAAAGTEAAELRKTHLAAAEQAAEQGNVPEAREHFLKILETNPGIEERADILLKVGMTFFYEKKFDEALAYVSHAESMTRKELGEKNELMSRVYQAYGGIYTLQQSPVMGMNYLNKALDIEREIQGEEHENVALLYKQIGVAQLASRDTERAVENMEKALNILNKSPEGKEASIGELYNYMGMIKLSGSNINEALPNLLKAEGILSKDENTDPEQLATLYNNISACYFLTEQYKEAFPYVQKTLEHYLSVYGELHPDVARLYRAQGDIYKNTGEPEKAVTAYNKSLDIAKYLPRDAVTAKLKSHLYGKLVEIYTDAKDQPNADKYVELLRKEGNPGHL